MGKKNGSPTMADFVAMRERRDSYAAEVGRFQSMLEAAEREIARLKGDCVRLSAEALAAQQNVQRLTEHGNTRYRAANDEVTRLRELCIANGINPNA